MAGLPSWKRVREGRRELLESHFGYRDDANPFEDAELSRPFVWRKRQQLLVAAGREAEAVTRKEQLVDLAREKADQVRAVRERREAYDRETREREEERALLLREQAHATFAEWERRETHFAVNSLLDHADARLRASRPSLADELLAAFVCARGSGGNSLSVPQDPPPARLAAADADALARLRRDAAEFVDWADRVADLVRSPAELQTLLRAQELKNRCFPCEPLFENLADLREAWAAALLLATDELRQREAAASPAAGPLSREFESGLPTPVVQDIARLLCQKPLDELRSMEGEVAAKLRAIRADPEADEDPQYWETVAAQIPLAVAAALLRDLHAAARRQGGAVAEPERAPAAEAHIAARPPAATNRRARQTVVVPVYAAPACGPALTPAAFMHEVRKLRAQRLEAYLRTLGSGKPGDGGTAEGGARAPFPPETPPSALRENSARARIFPDGENTLGPDEELLQAVAAGPAGSAGSGGGGSGVGGWAALQLKRPTFFNRVRTGYEWTRYNQAHFDRETPPPKAVQGYRFSVFYPELAAPGAKPPQWRLEPDEAGGEITGAGGGTVLIRFTGGPQYEDLVFRIVNREWDVNPRKGFRNVFERGVLQLHFNLKRMRYRK